MIRLENLTKTYKKQMVLDHLTHEFARGRIHGIIGRNGSGKTTLLRMICGIAVPTEGEIYLDGKPVSGKGIARFPADIGIVIENTGFIAQASGYRNLEYLASIRHCALSTPGPAFGGQHALRQSLWAPWGHRLLSCAPLSDGAVWGGVVRRGGGVRRALPAAVRRAA